MKTFRGAVCAGAVLVSGAFVTGAAAQNNQLSNSSGPVANPASAIANFSVQSVGPILNELGVTWEALAADTGQTYINASYQGVVNFRLVPTACRAAGYTDCVGLSMVSGFTGQANQQTVNAFNYRYAFASAGVFPTGEAYLSRYDICDYGIARGNVATSILVFIQQTAKFADELASASQTVSLEGFADDLAASQLNRQVREDLTGVAINATTPVELHQQGLEETAEVVRHFIADKSAPKNKISNFAKQ